MGPGARYYRFRSLPTAATLHPSLVPAQSGQDASDPHGRAFVLLCSVELQTLGEHVIHDHLGPAVDREHLLAVAHAPGR